MQELWGQHSCRCHTLPQLRRVRLGLRDKIVKRKVLGYISVDGLLIDLGLSTNRLNTARFLKLSS